jgi:hypothetical protein
MNEIPTFTINAAITNWITQEAVLLSDHQAALTVERDRVRGMANALKRVVAICEEGIPDARMHRPAWIQEALDLGATQPATTPACHYDTDGDGNCGKPACPVCGPVSYHPTQAPAAEEK